LSERQKAHLAFVQRLIEIRREQPALSRRRFFKNMTLGDDVEEIFWLDSTGRQMSTAEWNDGHLHSLGLLLLGHCSQIDDQGACIIGDNLLILMNSHSKPVQFAMPPVVQRFRQIERLFDTYDGNIKVVTYDATKPYPLLPRSMALFRHRMGKSPQSVS
jgi:glycogen operon protein